MNVEKIARELLSTARDLIAIEFPTQEALNKYLKDHPDADRANHKVVKTQEHHSLSGQAVHGKNGWTTSEGKALPEHVVNMVIPPAWKQVRFDPNPKAELVVQGFDEKGRLQSKYSDSHNTRMAAIKFARIGELLTKIPAIKKENEGNLKDSKAHENAACLRLIMATGIRPGSSEDTKAEKQAYGATTLLGSHVVKTKEGVHLKFTGKKGVDLDIPVEDKMIADDLLERAGKSGKDGRLFKTEEANLLKYTHSLDGGKFKTKDMRTMVGTSTALLEVKKMPKPKTAKEYVAEVKAVAKKVAEKLGNTPIVALQSYISPMVFLPWRQVGWGTLQGAGA